MKDGRYDYIETGSLISIKKNTKNITLPSEEERVTLYPMDYEEFRWALGEQVNDDKLAELLKDLEDSKTTLFSYHSNDPNVGMSLTKNISKYKIFCADTGLILRI